jgi:hypothetical protein
VDCRHIATLDCLRALRSADVRPSCALPPYCRDRVTVGPSGSHRPLQQEGFTKLRVSSLHQSKFANVVMSAELCSTALPSSAAPHRLYQLGRHR